MSSTGGPAGDWVHAWIEGQKTAFAKWSGERQPAGVPGIKSISELFAPALAAAQSALGAGAARGMPGSLGLLWGGQGAAATGAATGTWGIPGVGPLREQQAAAQAMASALADVERLSLEMAGTLARIHADTLDLLARRAAEQANQGKPVEDVKALYDLWIDCGEVTYAKVAHSDAYCRLQADLCNSGVRFQAAERQQMERWLKLLDLPTRAEVNTLNLRIRDLQRRLESAMARTPTAPKASLRKPAKEPVTARAAPVRAKRTSRLKS